MVNKNAMLTIMANSHNIAYLIKYNEKENKFQKFHPDQTSKSKIVGQRVL